MLDPAFVPDKFRYYMFLRITDLVIIRRQLKIANIPHPKAKLFGHGTRVVANMEFGGPLSMYP